MGNTFCHFVRKQAWLSGNPWGMAKASGSGLATSKTKYDHRRWFFLLNMGVFFCVGLTALGKEVPLPPGAEFTYKSYEVSTGSAQPQTVLTGFFLGGAIADLAVMHVDEKHVRRLCIYSFGTGTWEPKLNMTLRPGVMFVDVANMGGRDRLITYENGRLNLLDPETGIESKLLEVHSHFNPPHKKQIPHVDITQDLNGDNRDDLVVPGPDGFLVFIQREGNTFADPVKLGTASDMKAIYGADGYRYNPWRQSPVQKTDYNQDGRSDLVYWDGFQFKVHLQDKHGMFGAMAKTFKTEISFDTDKRASLATGGMVGRLLNQMTDLNGDGFADMVVFSLEGSNISRKRSAYEVHFGAQSAMGGTTFSPDVDVIIRTPRHIQLGIERYDFDNDGQSDLMLKTIQVGNLKSNPFRNFRGFMGGSILLNLEFYRMENGKYSDKPNAIRKIKLRFPATHQEPGWVPLDLALRGATAEGRPEKERQLGLFNAPVFIADVTGDKRMDLLLGWDRKQLRVFVGVPGPELFAKKAHKILVNLPHDEEYIWLADLNKDGMQDLLMHHASSTAANRLTIFMAK